MSGKGEGAEKDAIVMLLCILLSQQILRICTRNVVCLTDGILKSMWAPTEVSSVSSITGGHIRRCTGISPRVHTCRRQTFKVRGCFRQR